MKAKQITDPGCRHKDTLRLGGFLARSTVNGPGIRAVCWVQGCPIRCKGCFNTGFWPFAGGEEVTVRHLAAKILSIKDIDGVTFSGGEPFAQADALAQLGGILHDAGLSVVTFSGYTYDQLAASSSGGWHRLLAATDLLVAGPYIASLACSEPLRGSSNQQVIRLSDRLPVPEKSSGRDSATLEFTIFPDGSLAATGFPDESLSGIMPSIKGGA